MKKENNTTFSCSNCDAQYQKWTGRCLECGKWGTIGEVESYSAKGGSAFGGKVQKSTSKYEPTKTIGLSEIVGNDVQRLKTNIEELDRVLGGGVVPGSLILLSGDPGIGKSTLAIQLATAISNTLYISGEESVEQIKMRSNRIVETRHCLVSTLRLANETCVESIVATIQVPPPAKGEVRRGFGASSTEGPSLVIIDSIQTIFSAEVEGEPGNPNQIKACTAKLLECAKTNNIAIVLIGHVTKDGVLSGPKTMEHLVDTVLYLEGDKFHQFRILRAVKNRFGSTDEVGIFEMKHNGLIEVKNPSQAFLEGRGEPVPGGVVTCVIQGSRPILVEIQALVTKTNFGYPQRRASGFDLNRLQVLIGVLSKRTGLPLESYDVFLNVVGGLKADEPAADMAVIMAIASAIKNKTIPKNLATFGEVGLGGEVRNVMHSERRLNEIKKMGFEIAVIPQVKNVTKIPGLKIAHIENVKDVVEKIVK